MKSSSLMRLKNSIMISLLIALSCATTVFAQTNDSNATKVTEAMTTENKVYEDNSHQINLINNFFNTSKTTDIKKSEKTKVKKIKVKVKKTMTVSTKQKIKITKILPEKAENKDVQIVNKTKGVLKLKSKKLTAKNPGTGKIVVKSEDGGYEDVIKIKVKKQKPKCDDVELLYNARYNVTSNPLTPSMGVKQYDGHRETYYSQRVLPGGGLNIPGRHVADDGTIRDKDGYIVVATNYNFISKGSTFLTSLGPAKVYDTGCNYGTVDIYCNW